LGLFIAQYFENWSCFHHQVEKEGNRY